MPEEIISLHLGEREREEEEQERLGNDWEEEEPAREEDDDFSIFNIEIAQILWRRKRENSEVEEYLVKYKGRSYLHTQWLTEQEALAVGKNMKNKMNRFAKAHQERLQEGSFD